MAEKRQHAEVARHILEHAQDFEWSLQGFGMLRFYLTQELRLHVWDSRYRVENVSGIHTHPWHFDSTVLCGRVEQYRYICDPGYDYLRIGPHGTPDSKSKNFDQYLIKAGMGGHLDSEPSPVTLTPGWDYLDGSRLEVIEAGQMYSQHSDEIHLSLPEDGTVTIVQRKLADRGSPDHAFVFVPAGEEWVSAEPRMATPDEVKNITRHALERWF
jgi:hypothetical protein